jgi:alpha-1,4-digalacturonate transport system substrate-binding protein
MKHKHSVLLLLSMMLWITSHATFAQDVITFRCYQDNIECEVYADQLARFTEETGIAVNVVTVPYANIDEQLPIQVEAGEVPDIARITNFGAFAGHYFDATPYLDDETIAYWHENYPAPILAAMTNDGGEGLGGFPDAFTSTGPFVNQTLFELAEVEMPDFETATWEDWTEATAQVQEVLSSDELTIYAISVDRTGHRVAGPAMSMGATLINEDGDFTIDTEGFRAMVEMLNDWHVRGITPADVWLGSGSGVAGAIDYFINGELVMMMSGSWQINRLANEVGTNFDWIAVPNPQGAGGSTGVAGGAAVVGFAATQYPEEVAQILAYLSTPENVTEFAARTTALTANRTVAEQGIEYEIEDEAILAAMETFGAEVLKLQDQAAALNVHPFAFAYYRNSANRITQYLIGELSLEDALAGLQRDIDEVILTSSE